MHHGRDTDRSLHLLGGQTRGAHHFFVCSDAHAATVDRRNRQRPQLEVFLRSAGHADHVHAQLGGQAHILVVFREVQEAVVDVVHAHDRGRRLGGGEIRRRQLVAEFGVDRCDDFRVA